MRTSTKLFVVAIIAETLLISTGLGLAAVQSMGAYADHGNLTLAASAAAFPLLLAVLELFKIPAGVALYSARWIMKPFAALLLLGGTVATFETVTMAGSTWFRSLQFEVTAAQAKLNALQERQDGTGEQNSQIEAISAAIEALDSQIETAAVTPEVSVAQTSIDSLSAELAALRTRREKARVIFADEWDAQTANNTARIESGNAKVAEQGLLSQRSMPTRQAYVNARLDEWDASEGQVMQRKIAEIEAERSAAREALEAAREAAASSTAIILEDLRSERSRLQDELMAALADDRGAKRSAVELAVAIEAQRQIVSRLAGESLIYDIAAKAYGVPLHEVSEKQANVTTFWVILGVGLAAACATSVAAFMATCLAKQTRSSGHVAALQAVAARRRSIARRDRTIAALREELAAKQSAPPKVEYRDRIVYKYLPSDRDLAADGIKPGLHSVKQETADAA